MERDLGKEKKYVTNKKTLFREKENSVNERDMVIALISIERVSDKRLQGPASNRLEGFAVHDLKPHIVDRQVRHTEHPSKPCSGRDRGETELPDKRG